MIVRKVKMGKEEVYAEVQRDMVSSTVCAGPWQGSMSVLQPGLDTKPPGDVVAHVVGDLSPRLAGSMQKGLGKV